MSFLETIHDWFANITCHDDHATVTIRKGDTLWAIAKGYTGDGANWRQIAALNPGLDEQYVIQPGQEIKIPCDWVR